ncbi:MAG: hypothetical protein U0Q16_18915 [Bryobacteraceae bacterium]
MSDAALRALGIDPKRFRLLVALFHTLSERKEMLNQQLGFNQRSLTGGALLFAAMSTLLGIGLLIGGMDVASYRTAFLFLTAFAMTSILMAETAHTLVNPEEGMVLVHQPISGATYTAAKLVHLGRVVLYMTGGMNALPALLGLATKGASVLYPLRHMAETLAVGAAIAFACCALFGWLMRFIPPARMKAAAQVVAALSYLVMMPQLGVLKAVRELWKHAPAAGPWTQTAFVVAVIAAVVLGLRALSADYLIRVTRLVQGGSRKQRAGSRNSGAFALPGKLVSSWFGGPPARAGFAYLLRMMARDWQFRRQIIGFLPTLVIAVAATRSFDNPFGEKFSTVHLLPHTFGLMAFFSCSILKPGSHFKAAWVFQLSPAGAFPRLANGMYAALWTVFVLAPHGILLPLMVWRWGPAGAAGFTAYSAALVSVYLGLSVLLVDGLPFAHQPEVAQTSWMLGVLMGGGVVAALIVAFQHYFVFRSGIAAVLTTAGVAAMAALIGMRSVAGLAAAMRFYLERFAAGPHQLFQEAAN